MATKITTPELFNLSSNNTAATQLPVFTTSTRPTLTTSTITVDYLVVAGGGGGSGGASGSGGGGGAGGYRTATNFSVSTGINYSVIIGTGGAGGALNGEGLNGSSTTFNTIVAAGGGHGGYAPSSGNAGDGGSGGGGSSNNGSFTTGGSGNTPSVSPSQGNDGGNGVNTTVLYWAAGGGGGSSAAGQDGAYNDAGNGGAGTSNSITGNPVTYASGGGGGAWRSDAAGGSGGTNAGNGGKGPGSAGGNGVVNTGSGGGGGGQDGVGGNGGDGVVVLKYPTNSSPTIKTTGSLVYTESTDGSDTIIQFTEGSGNVSFVSAGITVGEMIFNSTTGKVEYWDGFKWNMIKDEAIISPLSTTNPFGDGSQLALYQFNGNANNANGTNNGIVSGSGGYTTGKFGQAINLTGATNSYVSSLKPPAFNQSMCFWVDFSNINFNADRTFYLNTGANSYYYWWYLALFYNLQSDKFYFGTYIRNSSSNYNYRGTGYTLTNLNKTGWNFIVATFPSGGNTTYSINNSTIATLPFISGQSGNITALVADNQIGRIYSNGAYYSPSGPIAIDQYRLFNKTLSQSEINTLYTEVV